MKKEMFEKINIEKSETFYKILKMLKSVYSNNTIISEKDMELLAQDLECSIQGGYSAADVISTVTYFWQRLLYSRERGVPIYDMRLDDNLIDYDEIDEIEVDSNLAEEWYIVDEIIDLLEVNEKNAHALCQSFVDEYNSYNAFVCLMTYFREHLSDDELDEIFDTATCFDDELVDCYRNS